jgi:hypothetical protein
MKIRLATIGIILGAIAIAHEGHDGKITTMTGTVIDTGCYISHNSTGDSHAKCAEACAKNGVPLAILDEKGALYMPIAVEHKDQNIKLMPFIEKKVKVTGVVMEKGGMKGIAIKTVDLAQ